MILLSAVYIGFLFMSQSSTQPGGIRVPHKAVSNKTCGGASVGENSCGCTDAHRGIRSDDQTLCSCAAIECLGEVDADAVFYEDKAYKADPEDDRMKVLVEKIDLDEKLSPAELQELQAIRLPELDHYATGGRDRGGAHSIEDSSEASNKPVGNANS